MGITTKIIKNRFPQLARDLPTKAAAIVEETKALVVVDAQRDAPKDTGFMASQIHATDTGVAGDADYTGDVEFGTRYQRAQPFFIQAHERQRTPMNTRLRTELFEE